MVRQEGKREVKREIEHYSLDVIIFVSYRVKSKQDTQFRIWATQRLREYLVQGGRGRRLTYLVQKDHNLPTFI